MSNLSRITPERIAEIEKRLCYTFKDEKFLVEAFTHSTCINELFDVSDCNERLEFLGDRVLNLIVAKNLFDFGGEPAKLNDRLDSLISAVPLAEITAELDIFQFMIVGNSMKGSPSINTLADLFEAVTAAVYLDSGQDISITANFVNTHVKREKYSYFINKYEKQKTTNYKGFLNEYADKKKIARPLYSTVTEKIESGAVMFVCELSLNNKKYKGTSQPSKKSAEQSTARLVCEKLKIEIK